MMSFRPVVSTADCDCELKTRVQAGDFFLTASQSPIESAFESNRTEPLETMHVYLGLPVFNRAIEEAFHGTNLAMLS